MIQFWIFVIMAAISGATVGSTASNPLWGFCTITVLFAIRSAMISVAESIEERHKVPKA